MTFPAQPKKVQRNDACDRRRRDGCRPGVVSWTLAILVAVPSGLSQDRTGSLPDASRPLFEREPFDRIVLTQEHNHKVHIVLPIDFPGRPDPNKLDRKVKLIVRLVDEPDKEYAIDWEDIERVELFEQMVLDQAVRLTGAGRFDEAFEHVVFLRDRAPNTPGLQAAVEDLLRREANQLFAQKNYERAWILLDELFQQNRKHSDLDVALQRVLDQLLAARLDSRAWREARDLYNTAQTKYADFLPHMLEAWRSRLTQLAAERVQAARQLADDQHYREAYLTTQQARVLWPELPEAVPMARQLARQYPVVRVGVTQPWHPDPAQLASRPPLADWPQRRCARLVRRALYELVDVGPEGGQYVFPFGTATTKSNLQTWELDFGTSTGPQRIGPLMAYHVARDLIESADASSPFGQPEWNDLAEFVEVSDISRVRVGLKRPHLRIEPYLGTLPDPRKYQTVYVAAVPYRVEPSGDELRFIQSPDYALATPGQPQEVIEHAYNLPHEAVAALRRGELDVVDRVFPTDVPALQQDPQLVVVPYRIPTVHVLIPNYTRPYLRTRAFRRALVYAIDRQGILSREILAGQSLEGCQVVTGPFPVGLAPDDPLGYAADPRIPRRDFEPRLSRVLLQLAQIEAEAAAQKAGQERPVLSEIRLVHPHSEIARVACASIAQDLEVLGLPCVVQALPVGKTHPEDNQWDLCYAEVVVGEPLVDAPRLLAADGLAACDSAHLNLMLRQLAAVTNWTEAGRMLRAIHQTCYDEVAVIPLWQIVDYLAYRKGLVGIRNRPVRLYQDIEQWQIEVP